MMARRACPAILAALLPGVGGAESAAALGFEVHTTSLCDDASLEHDVVLADRGANLTACTRVSLDASDAFIKMGCADGELIVRRYEGDDAECAGGTELFKATPSNAKAFFEGSCSVVKVTRGGGALDDRLFARFKSSFAGAVPACVGAADVAELWQWARTWDNWQIKYECGEIKTSTWRSMIFFYILYMMGLALVLAVAPRAWRCCCRCRRDQPHAGEHRPRPCSPPQELVGCTVDQDAAEKHLLLTSPVDADGNWRPILTTSVKEMGDIGGTGVELYFRLLRDLGFVFFYMAGLTLPTIVLSSLGDFAPDKGQRLHKTAIGNLGSPAEGGISQANRYVIVGCTAIHVTEVTEKIAWCDFLAIVVFLVFILDFHFRRVPRAEKKRAKEITCQDFTVEVDCLPPQIDDMTGYDQELRSHLAGRLRAAAAGAPGSDEQPPRVCQLALVRDFRGRLSQVKTRAKLLQEKKICEEMGDDRAVAKIQPKIDKVLSTLKALLSDEGLLDEGRLPVIRAFATLSTPGDAAALLHDYRFSAYGLFRRFQAEGRRFHSTAIRVRRAPEPTDIIWENQDVPVCQKNIREILIFAAIFLIIVVSLGIIYCLHIAAKSYNSTPQNYFQDGTCDPVEAAAASSARKCLIPEASNWTQAHAAGEGGDVLDCYCLTKGYAAILKDEGLLNACWDWLVDVGKDAVILNMASCIVVLVNVVVKVALRSLVLRGGSLSFSERHRSIMVAIAVVLILNTGFVMLSVNMWIGETLQALIIPFPGGAFIGRGDFNDFVRGWYSVVGVGLLVSMMANVVIPAAQSLAEMTWTFAKRRLYMRGWFASHGRHQQRLLELYTNPSFNISAKYAQLIMTVFVTLTFSAGLPLLNVFAAAYMLVTYWVDKTVLLWGSQRPPSYDAKMPSAASMNMLWATPVHLFVAILMLGQPCTFPSGHVGHQATTLTDRGLEGESIGGWVGARFFLHSTWMFAFLFFAFLACCLAWTLVWVLGKSVGKLFDLLLLYCRAGGKSYIAPDITWEEARERIQSLMTPASYDIKDSPQYSRLSQFLPGDLQTTGEAWTVDAKSRGHESGLVPPVPPDSLLGPVDPSIASGFIAALESQHARGEAGAVSAFLGAGGPGEGLHPLALHAEQIGGTPDPDRLAAIGRLAHAWGVPDAPAVD